MKQILVTDGTARADLFERLQQACLAGIDAIQIRERTMEAKDLYELIAKLHPIAAACGVSLHINERFDIALSSGIAGIHFPEKGLSPTIAKQIKTSLLIGCSVHSLEKALQKEDEGADQVFFGPIYPTATKPHAQGLDRLHIVASRLTIPVIAIGGITPHRAGECVAAGAKGVAAIGAYCVEEVKTVIKEFYEKIVSHSKHQPSSAVIS
jgi:thiamine-phosphate diphosphorylase